MASIEPRRNGAGVVTSYRVVWRDLGAKRSQAVASLEQAQQWKAVLEAAGHDTARATEALLSGGMATPPVVDVAEQHVAGLTGAQPYTVRKYRDYLRLHLASLVAITSTEVRTSHRLSIPQVWDLRPTCEDGRITCTACAHVRCSTSTPTRSLFPWNASRPHCRS